MTEKPTESKSAGQSDQNKESKPKYEPPKLTKFEKLQKLVVSGE